MQLPFYQIIGGVGCEENNFVSPQIIVSMIEQKYDLLRNIPNDITISSIEFGMDEDAGITDFVAQSAIPAAGLLVSTKAYNIIKGFNVQSELEEYNVVIDFEDKLYNYHWLNPVLDYFNFVDFQKTDFFALNIGTGEKRSTKILDFKDFFKKSYQMGGYNILTAENFKVKNIEPFVDLDLFLFSFRDKMLVSPRLKAVIESKNLTAVMFDDEPVFIQL